MPGGSSLPNTQYCCTAKSSAVVKGMLSSLPMSIYRSTSPFARARGISARLRVTWATLTEGCARLNCSLALRRNAGFTASGIPTLRVVVRSAAAWELSMAARWEASTWRSRSIKTNPAAVGQTPRLSRCSTSKPSSRSTAATCCISDCGETPMAEAAFEKLPASATAMSVSTWLKFMGPPAWALWQEGRARPRPLSCEQTPGPSIRDLALPAQRGRPV